MINLEGIRPSIFDYVEPIGFDIPLDCIDSRMEEQVDDYFEILLADFLSFSEPEEKQDFINQHQSFLQFVNWLNKNRNEINQKRVEAFR